MTSSTRKNQMYFFGSQLRFSWKCEGKASWQPWQCRARVQRSSRFNHSNLLCFWRLMPRDPKGPKGPKDQTSKKSKSEEQAEMAVLRAQLELARAERARADEKIRRLERQLLGEAGASKSSKSSKSPGSTLAWTQLSSSLPPLPWGSRRRTSAAE